MVGNPSDPATFSLYQWQVNEYLNSSGQQYIEDLPASWNMGLQTGFEPSGTPLSNYQMTMNPNATSTSPSTGAQVQGGTIGIYLNSADMLVPGENCNKNDPTDCKVGILPGVRVFPKDTFAPPFSSSTTILTVSLDLKVPTASTNKVSPCSSQSYIGLDILFNDPKTGLNVTFDGSAFSSGDAKSGGETIHIDPATQNIVVSSPVGQNGNLYSTPVPNTGVWTNATWNNAYVPYAFAISYANFGAAIQNIITQNITIGSVQTGQMSSNPSVYTLVGVHINGELGQATAACLATLGYSEQNFQISVSN